MLYPPSTGWPERNYHCRPTSQHTIIVPFLNDRPVRSQSCRPVGQHILHPPSTSWPDKIITADRSADICYTHLVLAGQTKIITADRPADICCTRLVPAGQKRNYHCRLTGQRTIIVPFLNRPPVRCSFIADRSADIYCSPPRPAARQNYHCRPTSRYMLYPPSTGCQEKLSLRPTGQRTIIVPFLNPPAGEIQVHCRPVGRHIFVPSPFSGLNLLLTGHRTWQFPIVDRPEEFSWKASGPLLMGWLVKYYLHYKWISWEL